MRLNRFYRTACAVFFATAIFGSAAKAAFAVGTGADFSYFVIEAAEFGAPLQYEFHYTFNASSPLDTYAMMTAIDAAEADLSFDFTNYGSPGSPNYFLNTITFNSISLDNGDPFWAQWVSGGKSGYPTPNPIASGQWTEGSGLSYRQLAPGSWDGFIYNGEYNPNPPYELTSPPPSTAPVPEPASILLFSLATGALLWLRRRHA